MYGCCRVGTFIVYLMLFCFNKLPQKGILPSVWPISSSACYRYFSDGMTSKTKTLLGKTPPRSHETAKPVHIQKLESAVDVRPFVTQVEKFLNSDGISDSDDDSDKSIVNETAKGDKSIRGVRTTKKGTIQF